MNNLRYINCQTPCGQFYIIIDDQDQAYASGFGKLADLKKRLPDNLQSVELRLAANHKYTKLVDDYFAGNLMALKSIPKKQAGTDFQKRVWQVIADIPCGKTLSYKELAQRSGNPAAVRAAGTVCGLNRLVLLIPCHRVLKSDGSLGNYLYGTKLKKHLLEHEKAI